MFVDEARIAARVNHPNVVQTLEVGEDQGTHFLAMEYLDGQPLHRLLRRGRATMPLSMHLAMLTDVLGGLHHAHELRDFDGRMLNVVHRDVSPQNVFVTYDGQVKVIDFGIAKAHGRASETRLGVVKGKVAYMSPEQAQGKVLDRRADIFAAGLMIWEAATHRRYWLGVGDADIVRFLFSGVPLASIRDFDRSLPDALDRICRQALALNPDDRYPTAAALQADLDAFIDGNGPRSSTREIGRFASDLFGDRRAQLKAVVESQLAELRRIKDDPDAPYEPADATEYKKADFAMEGEVQHRTLVDMSPRFSLPSRVAAVSEGKTSAPSSPRRFLPPLVALAASVALAMFLSPFLRARERQKQLGPAPVAAVATINLSLRAAPAQTQFRIDGGEWLANPYDGTRAKDALPHTLEATANGYAPKTETLRFESDVSIRFVLSAKK